MKTSEIADNINKIIKSLPTKQDKDPYIWDYNIKVRTKDGYDYEVINHIDHNKLNNNISNLEYITQKENIKDAWNNGLCENIRKQAKNNIIKAYSSRRNNYGKC